MKYWRTRFEPYETGWEIWPSLYVELNSRYLHVHLSWLKWYVVFTWIRRPKQRAGM